MKKIIILLTLAAFVAAPMESIAQNTQNQSKSLFDVMMRHQQENKDKKKCMMQAIGHGAPSGDIVRLASQDEVNYGKNNSYLSTSNSSHIYFVYRGYWEKDIQRKSGLALFGEKIN